MKVELLDYAEGATPLKPEDLELLIPTIATQGDLNEFELQNIVRGERWARGNARFRREFLSYAMLLDLHGHMFGDTWKFAGQRRMKDGYNIGIPFVQIPDQIKTLLDDATYRIQNGWPWVVTAVRFHHHLVWIHPFTNGNGRHSRLAADLLLEFNGQPPLPWGGGSLVGQSAIRDEYIAALKEADTGSYDRLLKFAQSR